MLPLYEFLENPILSNHGIFACHLCILLMDTKCYNIGFRYYCSWSICVNTSYWRTPAVFFLLSHWECTLVDTKIIIEAIKQELLCIFYGYHDFSVLDSPTWEVPWFGSLPCDVNIQMKLLNLSDLIMLVTGEALWSLIDWHLVLHLPSCGSEMA